jgi:DNA-binding NtrC family response regulator
MNVRELVNLSMRIQALIGSKGAPGLELLPGAMQAPLLDRFEAEGDEEEAEDPRSKSPDRQILEMAIKRSLGNVQLAAQQNGWHRTQLYRWLRRAKIDPSAFRPPE